MNAKLKAIEKIEKLIAIHTEQPVNEHDMRAILHGIVDEFYHDKAMEHAHEVIEQERATEESIRLIEETGEGIGGTI